MMNAWLQFLIAALCLWLFVLVVWKASMALTRRGIIVRPVSLMDREMTKIERQFANSDAAAPLSSEPPPKT